jgi:predicted dehydrogenase
VSDAIVAPWSWELTTGENPVYPRIEALYYFVGGTHGSLTIPYLDVWSNPGKRSWWEPIDATRESYVAVDPLVAQICNFCRVVRGQEVPVVSGREGLETLKVILAVKEAAASGRMVKLT